MSYGGTLCMVMAAIYGLASVLLSIVVVCAWRAGLDRTRLPSGALLVLRLLPSVGALFLTLTVVLPAFLIYERAHDVEPVGPWLVVLVILALATVGHGILRGWRACRAAAALLRNLGPGDRCSVMVGQDVDVVQVPEPMVAVVGAWRPRIVAASSVRAACSDEEFRLVVAHEAAHLAAHDNLKLLLLLVSPDALAWMPAGDAVIARWRAAAELEADARASGPDRRKRIALASALIKVARLANTGRRCPLLAMPIAADDVAGRVRRLLAPPSTPRKPLHQRAVMAGALLIAIGVVPLYGAVQEFVEVLVVLGR
jgi:Zn-dependent protease with chaperone function